MEEGATTIITHYLCYPPTIGQNSSPETNHTTGGHQVEAAFKADCEQPEYARHTDYESEASRENIFGPATGYFRGKL
jgi:hypothetical protein